MVDLFHVLYCSGSMCVGVTVWFRLGWCGILMQAEALVLQPAGDQDEVEHLILVTSRQNRQCLITQTVTQSSAPEDGRSYRPKHVELIEIINDKIIVASSWLFILKLFSCLRLKFNKEGATMFIGYDTARQNRKTVDHLNISSHTRNKRT